jgi:GNAT superfamily N-acetyltransferase
MANRREDDFFVTFGSNARTFSRQLPEDLAGAREAVRALQTDIDKLSQTASRSPGKASIAQGLLSELGQMNALGTTLRTTMAGVADELGRVLGALKKVSAVPAPRAAAGATRGRSNIGQAIEEVQAAPVNTVRRRAAATKATKAAEATTAAAEETAQAVETTATATKAAAAKVTKTSSRTKKAAEQTAVDSDKLAAASEASKAALGAMVKAGKLTAAEAKKQQKLAEERLAAERDITATQAAATKAVKKEAAAAKAAPAAAAPAPASASRAPGTRLQGGNGSVVLVRAKEELEGLAADVLNGIANKIGALSITGQTKAGRERLIGDILKFQETAPEAAPAEKQAAQTKTKAKVKSAQAAASAAAADTDILSATLKAAEAAQQSAQAASETAANDIAIAKMSRDQLIARRDALAVEIANVRQSRLTKRGVDPDVAQQRARVEAQSYASYHLPIAEGEGFSPRAAARQARDRAQGEALRTLNYEPTGELAQRFISDTNRDTTDSAFQKLGRDSSVKTIIDSRQDVIAEGHEQNNLARPVTPRSKLGRLGEEGRSVLSKAVEDVVAANEVVLTDAARSLTDQEKKRLGVAKREVTKLKKLGDNLNGQQQARLVAYETEIQTLVDIMTPPQGNLEAARALINKSKRSGGDEGSRSRGNEPIHRSDMVASAPVADVSLAISAATKVPPVREALAAMKDAQDEVDRLRAASHLRAVKLGGVTPKDDRTARYLQGREEGVAREAAPHLAAAEQKLTEATQRWQNAVNSLSRSIGDELPKSMTKIGVSDGSHGKSGAVIPAPESVRGFTPSAGGAFGSMEELAELGRARLINEKALQQRAKAAMQGGLSLLRAQPDYDPNVSPNVRIPRLSKDASKDEQAQRRQQMSGLYDVHEAVAQIDKYIVGVVQDIQQLDAELKLLPNTPANAGRIANITSSINALNAALDKEGLGAVAPFAEAREQIRQSRNVADGPSVIRDGQRDGKNAQAGGQVNTRPTTEGDRKAAVGALFEYLNGSYQSSTNRNDPMSKRFTSMNSGKMQQFFDTEFTRDTLSGQDSARVGELRNMLFGSQKENGRGGRTGGLLGAATFQASAGRRLNDLQGAGAAAFGGDETLYQANLARLKSLKDRADKQFAETLAKFEQMYNLLREGRSPLLQETSPEIVKQRLSDKKAEGTQRRAASSLEAAVNGPKGRTVPGSLDELVAGDVAFQRAARAADQMRELASNFSEKQRVANEDIAQWVAEIEREEELLRKARDAGKPVDAARASALNGQRIALGSYRNDPSAAGLRTAKDLLGRAPENQGDVLEALTAAERAKVAAAASAVAKTQVLSPTKLYGAKTYDEQRSLYAEHVLPSYLGREDASKVPTEQVAAKAAAVAAQAKAQTEATLALVNHPKYGGWDADGNKIKDARSVEAYKGGELVGTLDHMVDRMNKVVEVTGTFVDPAHRRQGIGSAMQDELAARYPGYTIDHGARTSEGAAFMDSYAAKRGGLGENHVGGALTQNDWEGDPSQVFEESKASRAKQLQAMSRLTTAFANGDITQSEYNQELTRLKGKFQVIAPKLEEQSTATTQYTEAELRAAAAALVAAKRAEEHFAAVSEGSSKLTGPTAGRVRNTLQRFLGENTGGNLTPDLVDRAASEARTRLSGLSSNQLAALAKGGSGGGTVPPQRTGPLGASGGGDWVDRIIAAINRVRDAVKQQGSKGTGVQFRDEHSEGTEGGSRTGNTGSDDAIRSRSSAWSEGPSGEVPHRPDHPGRVPAGAGPVRPAQAGRRREAPAEPPQPGDAGHSACAGSAAGHSSGTGWTADRLARDCCGSGEGCGRQGGVPGTAGTGPCPAAPGDAGGPRSRRQRGRRRVRDEERQVQPLDRVVDRPSAAGSQHGRGSRTRLGDEVLRRVAEGEDHRRPRGNGAGSQAGRGRGGRSCSPGAGREDHAGPLGCYAPGGRRPPGTHRHGERGDAGWAEAQHLRREPSA